MSKFKAETSGLKILGWDVENEKSMEELWEKPLFMDEGEKKPGKGEGAELWPSTRTGWYITKAGPQEQEFPHLPPGLLPATPNCALGLQSFKQGDLIPDH